MLIEQIYTGCLAQGAYYIESEGEVAIIDPLRETHGYIQKAAERGATIKYILETHFHADFVSGHLDLSKKTGAAIVYGPTAQPAFSIHQAKDGEVLTLGKLKIEVLHTPGHTMESTCYLLRDEQGAPHAVFTGDTLFIGDVGRPDLAQKAATMTQEQLAATLYHSLRNKLMTLPDSVLVYPGHGAGSACGKNLSSQTWDTIGGQRASNYALRADMTEAEFVQEVTDGLLPPPQYFPQNVAMNKSAITSVDDVLARGTVALDPDTFEGIANHEGAMVIDTRSADAFVAGHIPNSIFIGIDGSFAPWVGALVPDLKQPLVLVTDAGREQEVVTRLSRVGYDNTMGYLAGGIDAWKAAGKEVDQIQQITADSLAQRLETESLNLLDVRKPGEWEAEHLAGVPNVPLDYLNDHMDEIDPDKTYFAHCAGGYRSVIFNSILKARGYHNIVDIAGGFKALAATPLPKTNYVCPSTLK
jgi:glyoxylase-like metal-dependent hydrolase (beta-lactamase superfamily II)